MNLPFSRQRRRPLSLFATEADNSNTERENSSQELEKSVARNELLELICGAMVFIGVAWECTEKFQAFIKTPSWQLFWWAVAASIGELLIGIGVFGELYFGRRASAKQDLLRDKDKREIARLNHIAETQQLARVKIEARTRHIHSRELFQDEVERLAESAKTFSGQLFWIIIQSNNVFDFTQEQYVFSFQLRAILIDAGWILGGPLHQLEKRIVGTGVEISSGTSDGAQRAAQSLRSILHEFGIYSQAPTTYDFDPQDFVLIDVGLK
jgi:hypothetical protein